MQLVGEEDVAELGPVISQHCPIVVFDGERRLKSSFPKESLISVNLKNRKYDMKQPSSDFPYSFLFLLEI